MEITIVLYIKKLERFLGYFLGTRELPDWRKQQYGLFLSYCVQWNGFPTQTWFSLHAIE